MSDLLLPRSTYEFPLLSVYMSMTCVSPTEFFPNRLPHSSLAMSNTHRNDCYLGLPEGVPSSPAHVDASKRDVHHAFMIIYTSNRSAPCEAYFYDRDASSQKTRKIKRQPPPPTPEQCQTLSFQIKEPEDSLPSKATRLHSLCLWY